jgi:anti-sigma B factor antagonist
MSDATDLGRLLTGAVTHVDGRVVYALSGDVDVSNAERLFERLVELGSIGGHRLDLDMADVGFIDSSGLRTLLNLAAHLASNDGRLRVLRPSPPVVQLVRLTETEGVLGFPPASN